MQKGGKKKKGEIFVVVVGMDRVVPHLVPSHNAS